MTGRTRHQMIAVTGEALINLVIDQHGRLAAQAGGGPLNTARTIGRLGLARLSSAACSAPASTRTASRCRCRN